MPHRHRSIIDAAPETTLLVEERFEHCGHLDVRVDSGQRASHRNGIGKQEEAAVAVEHRRKALFHHRDVVAHRRNITVLHETEFEHRIEMGMRG
jgi:hypothetical protein